MPADTTQTLIVDDVRATSERPLLGKVVDQRYKVLAHIGSGGMADVYEVEHVALGRRLAMKVLRQTRTSNPQLSRRFSREARAASRLDSEHVVAINDYGILPEGFPYFVMKLLHGQNLRSLLQAEPRLPVARVVNLAIDVCLGLHCAHSAGLVHRDLKPENLWLSRGDDGRELCVLLDFGVARFEGAHTTGDGVLVGTARYMSPEQIGSERAPGPASDLFSLGVLLYEALTGIPPFAADSLERTLFRILNEAPKPLDTVMPEVPRELAAVLERVLAKAPEQRFQSALDFAASLRPFAGVPRLLPSLGAATGQALTDDTLAEEPAVSSTPYADASPERRHAGKVGRGPLLLAFGAGLLLGSALLFTRSGDGAPSAAPTVSAAAIAAAPSVAAAASEASAPASVTPSLTAELGAVSSAPRNTSLPLRTKPHLVAPAPSAVKPARPEPPSPNFDGRNPYRQ